VKAQQKTNAELALGEGDSSVTGQKKTGKEIERGKDLRLKTIERQKYETGSERKGSSADAKNQGID